jgi:hypothetical protein
MLWNNYLGISGNERVSLQKLNYECTHKEIEAENVFSYTFAFGKVDRYNNNTIWQNYCQYRLSGVNLDWIFVVMLSSFDVFIDFSKMQQIMVT